MDVNKGDDETPNYRTRLVAKDFRRKAEDSIFAPTPPFETLRNILRLAATAVILYLLCQFKSPSTYAFCDHSSTLCIGKRLDPRRGNEVRNVLVVPRLQQFYFASGCALLAVLHVHSLRTAQPVVLSRDSVWANTRKIAGRQQLATHQSKLNSSARRHPSSSDWNLAA